MNEWTRVVFKTERHFTPLESSLAELEHKVEREGHLNALLGLRNWVQARGITVDQGAINDIGEELFELCKKKFEENPYHHYIQFKFNSEQGGVFYRCG